MTDKEIIRALECCSTATCISNKCEYENMHDIPKCTTQLTKDALALITRQKAEIERLENSGIRANSIDDWLKHCNELRAEAVKEFAEKIEEKLRSEIECNLKKRKDYERAIFRGANISADCVYHIDAENTNFEMLIDWLRDILKEMVGEG